MKIFDILKKNIKNTLAPKEKSYEPKKEELFDTKSNTPNKPAVKKTTPSKPVVKKATNTKPSVKKTTIPKPAVKKTIPSKPVAKTTTASKSAVKKTTAEHKENNAVWHITKRTSDGQWQVKKEKATRATKLFKTKAEAEEYVKGLKNNNDGSRVVSHKMDGEFQKKH